jgi:hypothetical protein
MLSQKMNFNLYGVLKVGRIFVKDLSQMLYRDRDGKRHKVIGSKTPSYTGSSESRYTLIKGV